MKLIINSIVIHESNAVELLGITVDNKLTFNEYEFNYAPSISMLCRKNQYLKNQKIHHKALKVVFNSDGDYDELLQQ